MKRWKSVQNVAALMACCGLMVPSACLYAEPPSAGLLPAIDLELDGQSIASGWLLDTTGQPLADVPVAVRYQDQVVSLASTAPNGQFRLGPLSGGAYTLVAGGNAFNLRAWMPGTAPPAASQQAVLYVGSVERGQDCTTGSCTVPGAVAGGGPLALLMNPFVIGAAVAAAIAIPLALDDYDAS